MKIKCGLGIEKDIDTLKEYEKLASGDVVEVRDDKRDAEIRFIERNLKGEKSC